MPSFDSATKNEIDLMLSLGADPSSIVYAHTIKNPSYIRWAKEKGVQRMTFDNVRELKKVSYHPRPLGQDRDRPLRHGQLAVLVAHLDSADSR